MLWAGSQNLTAAAVSYNDDASVRLVVQDARGAHATAAWSMWRAYEVSWQAMSHTTTSCTAPAVPHPVRSAAQLAGEPLIGLDG